MHRPQTDLSDCRQDCQCDALLIALLANGHSTSRCNHSSLITHGETKQGSADLYGYTTAQTPVHTYYSRTVHTSLRQTSANRQSHCVAMHTYPPALQTLSHTNLNYLNHLHPRPTTHSHLIFDDSYTFHHRLSHFNWTTPVRFCEGGFLDTIIVWSVTVFWPGCVMRVVRCRVDEGCIGNDNVLEKQETLRRKNKQRQ